MRGFIFKKENGFSFSVKTNTMPFVTIAFGN